MWYQENLNAKELDLMVAEFKRCKEVCVRPDLSRMAKEFNTATACMLEAWNYYQYLIKHFERSKSK